MFDAAILIADDDDAYRTFYEELFSKARFRVMTARDGMEAWEILQRETPDVLFVGLDMPRLDGLSLIRRLRMDDRFSRMKTFIFSHHGRPKDQEEADSLGAEGFFVAGYTPPAEVILRVREALSTPRRFTLKVDPEKVDKESQESLEEIRKYIRCTPSCRGPYTFTFASDLLRLRSFFSAEIQCPVCEKKRELPPPS